MHIMMQSTSCWAQLKDMGTVNIYSRSLQSPPIPRNISLIIGIVSLSSVSRTNADDARNARPSTQLSSLCNASAMYHYTQLHFFLQLHWTGSCCVPSPYPTITPHLLKLYWPGCRLSPPSSLMIFSMAFVSFPRTNRTKATVWNFHLA